jgi:hypothetical protein
VIHIDDKKETPMKCYTVTENGVTDGIQFTADGTYPHVVVGDPDNPYLMRRVKVDDGLAHQARNHTIGECSIELDVNDDDRRRASYRLVPAGERDTEQALVKLEAHCNRDGGRTWYWLPRNAFSVAVGEYADPDGHRTRVPVNLLVVHKDDVVEICRTEDVWKAPEHVFDIRYDGSTLRQGAHGNI